MLQFNPIDLYTLHKNKEITPTVNPATSFSDTLQTASQSLDDIFQKAAQSECSFLCWCARCYAVDACYCKIFGCYRFF